jgi:hypothetical protein
MDKDASGGARGSRQGGARMETTRMAHGRLRAGPTVDDTRQGRAGSGRRRAVLQVVRAPPDPMLDLCRRFKRRRPLLPSPSWISATNQSMTGSNPWTKILGSWPAPRGALGRRRGIPEACGVGSGEIERLEERMRGSGGAVTGGCGAV